MTEAKFDIEKFDRTGDFELWRIKMRALLIQHRCEATLEVLPTDMEAEAKVELNKKAHSAMILCLGNKVLREVTGETTALGIWSKLEALYMTSNILTLCGYLALWMGSFDFGGRDSHTKYKENQRKDHLKRSCPKNNRKKSTCYVKKDGQPSSSGSIYDDYESDKVKVINGSNVVLSGTRRDICVYSLDGHAVAGELNTSVEEKYSLARVEAVNRDQTRRTVKKLRTDNGLEFYNREFKQLYTKSGIARHMTVSGLPKTFWAKVTCTTTYLINRTSSTMIEKMTPMKMWSGHPRDYGKLRIFCRVTYSHVKQGKLKPKAVKCVLLGYPEGVKWYMLSNLDNESPKIFTRMNMFFTESMYKDTLKDSGASTDKSVEELLVEVELQGLNNRTLKEDQTDQEDSDDEDT
ncbi:retrotransposon protein, putative, ty1-copia subclass [Tanacetum coccineum]